MSVFRGFHQRGHFMSEFGMLLLVTIVSTGQILMRPRYIKKRTLNTDTIDDDGVFYYCIAKARWQQ